MNIDHVSKLLETGNESKAIRSWNQQVQTDRTFRNNKPDIIIRHTENRTYVLIDVAMLRDRNVI